MKKNILRVVALLLICCILVSYPIKAKATSIGAAAGIVKASTVTCNPYIIVGASIVALGVYAGVETGVFETVVNNCVDALESAGTWVKDGVAELLRTEDEAGNVSYYVDGAFLEDVRSWTYDSSTVTMSSGEASGTVYSPSGTAYSFSNASAPVFYKNVWFKLTSDSSRFSTYSLLCSAAPFDSGSSKGQCYRSIFRSTHPYANYSTTEKFNAAVANYEFIGSFPDFDSVTSFLISVLPLEIVTTSLDVSLGSFPAQTSNLIDGSSARQWSEEYTDRGLKVYQGGSGNNNNDGKWFWKLMLPLTAAELLLMSQADEWFGETPDEFSDYTTTEEYDIISEPEPEEEYGSGLEIAPSSDSDSNPDPELPTYPDDTVAGSKLTDFFEALVSALSWSNIKTWIEGIWNSVLSIPDKIAELPASIAEKFTAFWNSVTKWLEDLHTGVISLPQGIADTFTNFWNSVTTWLENLHTGVLSISQAIADVLADVFIPAEDYISVKVEALAAEYAFVPDIVDSVTLLKNNLVGDGGPPVIYVDFGRAGGNTNYGGKVLLTDFAWYEEYKPTVDALLSAALWAFFLWRVFLKMPGIIGGESAAMGSAFTSYTRRGRDE